VIVNADEGMISPVGVTSVVDVLCVMWGHVCGCVVVYFSSGGVRYLFEVCGYMP
jgi:hypothetical protein